MDSLTNKYAEESAKRFRSDGSAQYMELAEAQSPALADLVKDPFNAQMLNPQDGDSSKLAPTPDNIRLVDTAGVFGGTWYWNRYPGPMVDVEASIYMPLLEETGHMPGHRFPHGPEIRREPSVDMAVTAQFAIIAGGVLNPPKTPKIPGLDTFSGQRMHTGRWKYDISGGAHPMSGRYPASRGRRPASWAPEPPPSSWQSPVCARWPDELHVFQRTPSNVDGRDQRRTNPQEWRQITLTKG
ncbi:hypothetical protein H633G_05905 [Metarhizium anisopliae BRIP 53284]|nr:hypothetical protein H633G_05905 [Metarhizium anisopliae BRIP 53284]